jgi:hypothetical protein
MGPRTDQVTGAGHPSRGPQRRRDALRARVVRVVHDPDAVVIDEGLIRHGDTEA